MIMFTQNRTLLQLGNILLVISMVHYFFSSTSVASLQFVMFKNQTDNAPLPLN